jgi:hypothetical protein
MIDPGVVIVKTKNNEKKFCFRDFVATFEWVQSSEH